MASLGNGRSLFCFEYKEIRMNPYSKYDLKKYIESIPPEQMEDNNRLQEEKSEAMMENIYKKK